MLLAVYKAVLFGGVDGMPAAHFAARTADRLHDSGFDTFLGRPAFLIRREAQITTRDDDYRFCHLKLLCHGRSRRFARRPMWQGPAAEDLRGVRYYSNAGLPDVRAR